MAAKQILLSTDDVAYFLLPGSQGELTRDGAALEDTVFGQTYKSAQTGVITWGIKANAVYKGFPGYIGTLKKQGTSTATTAEAFSVVTGKTYQVTSTTKRIFDRAVAIVVKDNAVNQVANVQSIDPLQGKITFKSTYTVIGPVTADYNFFPLITLGKFTAFTLTQNADAIKNSDIPTLQGNSGYHTFTPGLKSCSLDIPMVFNQADAWYTALQTRGEYIIEINPDGTGTAGSLARGFFRLENDNVKGNVGALEEETLKFDLNVPWPNAVNTFDIVSPFAWIHGGSSPIPTAIKNALTQWSADATIFAKYLPDGGSTASAGKKGTGVITSLTLTAGMEAMNNFAVELTMSGIPTDV